MEYSINQQIYSILRSVKFPGGNKNIVFLELIKELKIEENNISFTLLIPQIDENSIKSLVADCENAISNYFGDKYQVKGNIKVEIKQVNFLSEVKNIVVVASGKGGVGKSTITTNLAVALALEGYKVGLLDADIYGPSIPKMFNVENQKPDYRKENNNDIIEPIEKFGIKLNSIGFFVDPNDALVWRGPMASNALRQLIQQTYWGELDFLLIDLPPGTSDIHLTVVQELAVTGAIIVSTPQQVALADVVKGINMFSSEKINVPLLGIVENMSWFTPAELPNNKYYIFGKDGCKELAKNMNIAVLGEIPLVQSVCEQGDAGEPSALQQDTIVGKAFSLLSKNVVKAVSERKAKFEPTKKVERTTKR